MMDLGIGTFGIVIVIVLLYFLSSIKILAEYERGVIFRLGRLRHEAKGPGVIFVFAPVDRMVRISLRQEALEVPPQDIITRDNVTLKVNAVIFLRVIEPTRAVVEVSNYVYQTSQFAQTTLRSVLGEGTRRTARAPGKNQPPAAKHSRHAHRSLGREGGERRSQASGHAGIDAAGNGQAGGSGTRETFEDHSRGRRVLGCAAPGGCGELIGHRAGQHSAPLSTNPD